MVRPKGGRSNPRYWQLKDAAEERMTNLMGKHIYERSSNKPVDVLVYELKQTDEQINALLERLSLSLMAAALMNPTVIYYTQ